MEDTLLRTFCVARSDSSQFFLKIKMSALFISFLSIIKSAINLTSSRLFIRRKFNIVSWPQQLSSYRAVTFNFIILLLCLHTLRKKVLKFRLHLPCAKAIYLCNDLLSLIVHLADKLNKYVIDLLNYSFFSIYVKNM